MPNLYTLRLANTNISGPIPEELFLSSNLIEFNITNANMEGTLSENFRNLNASLFDLMLSYNNFHGPIPKAFDALTGLETLLLQGNQLTGSISSAVCAERGLRFQQLATLIVDCRVICNCCDNCYESTADIEAAAQAALQEDAEAFADFVARLEEVQYQSGVQVFDPSVFEDETSPQFRAAKYMVQEKKHWVQMGAATNDPHYPQRYALTVFYFATGGDDWDCDTTAMARSGCDIRGWPNRGNLEECAWDGIQCNDEGKVIGIVFPYAGRGLDGTLPPELYLLNNLQMFSVPNNPHLAGTISPSISNLADIHNFTMWNTGLAGTIPPELFSLRVMVSLGLGRTDLSGTIPEELRFLNSTLMDLNLSYNNLNGSIPAALNYLTVLGLYTTELPWLSRHLNVWFPLTHRSLFW